MSGIELYNRLMSRSNVLKPFKIIKSYFNLFLFHFSVAEFIGKCQDPEGGFGGEFGLQSFQTLNALNVTAAFLSHTMIHHRLFKL